MANFGVCARELEQVSDAFEVRASDGDHFHDWLEHIQRDDGAIKCGAWHERLKKNLRTSQARVGDGGDS